MIIWWGGAVLEEGVNWVASDPRFEEPNNKIVEEDCERYNINKGIH